jgi:hypothetical protein
MASSTIVGGHGAVRGKNKIGTRGQPAFADRAETPWWLAH